ncbi:MAG: TRAP transporter large permease subunit [Burkholderiaceae bacterium]
MATGLVAAGGTLGALIPPSIPFIVFAILAEHSVGQLLLAGLAPGLLTLLGYLIAVAVWARIKMPAGARRAMFRMAAES